MLSPLNLIHSAFLAVALGGLALLARQRRCRHFCAILAGVAVLMAFNVLEESGLTRSIHMVTPVFALLWGPLLYRFSAEWVGYPIGRPGWVDALPALLALPFTDHVQQVLLLGALSQALYAIRIARLLRSAAGKTDAWLMRGLLAFGVLAVVDGVRHAWQRDMPLAPAMLWYGVMLLAHLSLFVYMIGHLVDAAAAPPPPPGQAEDQRAAPAAQSLDYERSLFALIEAEMHQSRLYEQARLSLRDVAQATGLLERDVSRAINLIEGKSFNEFVNALRIAAVQGRLAQRPDASILDVAFACGFGSKSTFNSSFKRCTGMTPSAYAASVRSESDGAKA